MLPNSAQGQGSCTPAPAHRLDTREDAPGKHNYQTIIKCFIIFVVIPAMVKTVKKLTELIIEAVPLLQRFVLQLQLF